MRRSLAASLVLLSTSALATSGCSTSVREVFDPEDAPTMLQIYDGHLARAGQPYTADYAEKEPKRGLFGLGRRGEADQDAAVPPAPAPPTVPYYTPIGLDDYRQLTAYTATTETETRNLFPTLPNPTLVMYVHPHLAGAEGLPVPGYSTPLTLYERTQYALPGDELVADRTPAEMAPTPTIYPGAPSAPAKPAFDDRLIRAAMGGAGR